MMGGGRGWLTSRCSDPSGCTGDEDVLVEQTVGREDAAHGDLTDLDGASMKIGNRGRSNASIASIASGRDVDVHCVMARGWVG